MGNTSNQPSKFRTKIWAEINDGTYNNNSGTYNTNSQTEFKTSMLKSVLRDYTFNASILNIGISPLCYKRTD